MAEQELEQLEGTVEDIIYENACLLYTSQGSAVHAAQRFQVCPQGSVQLLKQHRVAALGTAHRLRDHFFHDAAAVQILSLIHISVSQASFMWVPVPWALM